MPARTNQPQRQDALRDWHVLRPGAVFCVLLLRTLHLEEATNSPMSAATQSQASYIRRNLAATLTPPNRLPVPPNTHTVIALPWTLMLTLRASKPKTRHEILLLGAHLRVYLCGLVSFDTDKPAPPAKPRLLGLKLDTL